MEGEVGRVPEQVEEEELERRGTDWGGYRWNIMNHDPVITLEVNFNHLDHPNHDCPLSRVEPRSIEFYQGHSNRKSDRLRFVQEKRHNNWNCSGSGEQLMVINSGRDR